MNPLSADAPAFTSGVNDGNKCCATRSPLVNTGIVSPASESDHWLNDSRRSRNAPAASAVAGGMPLSCRLYASSAALACSDPAPLASTALW